ncbi:MAG: c-type cytochrome domain-containing protein, partial [Verrucomicrobiota bacterium]
MSRKSKAIATSAFARVLYIIVFLISAPVRSMEKSALLIDFNRDIRPIFSENCYACHGPDQNKRKAGLRLDHEADAFKVLKSGKAAVVPHDPAQSELIRRVTTSDPEDRMPPPDFLKQLNKT